MGRLILLNDVSTDLDEAQLLVGDSDPPANKQGKKEADVISAFFNDKIKNVDLIFSSDAQRLKKLVHNIRAESRDQSLTSLTPRRVEALRERSFGVLNRTPFRTESDLFHHTRIKSENGESVFECRVRIVKYIQGMAEKAGDKTMLFVSHPFTCQIAFNAILQKDHTLLTEFWMEKGSFVVFKFESGKYGIRWELENAYNAIVDSTYTQDEIYSRILGKKGALPG